MKTPFYSTIFYFLILVLLIACNNSKPDSKQANHEKFEKITTETNFNSKEEIEATEVFKYNNEEINVKLKYKDDYISGKTSNGTTFFSKKEFLLIPAKIEDTYNQLIETQNNLKTKELIGLETKFITINNQLFLFQESYDKRVVESNKRRDGALFLIEKNVVKILHPGASDNVDSLETNLNNLINKFTNSEIDINCLFDINKVPTFKKAIKEEFFNKYIVQYYLNPVSNKIEPFLAWDTKIDNSFYFDYLSDKIDKIDKLSCLNNNYKKYFTTIGDTLTLTNKQTTINEPVVIPNGYILYLKNGDRINLTNEAFLCSYSAFYLQGIANDSVYFTSSDKTSKGVHVFNTSLTSNLNYVSFSNFNNLNYLGWTLPSAVTFYEAPVSISNCLFSNNNCEDGLNIFRSPYTFSYSTIKNTFSDAFDADFSNGTITNCNFINSGNDGIDISGSELKATNCKFEKIADKALSAGENSKMTIDSIEINYAALAIVAKDLSQINIQNSFVYNSEVVFSAFQKKKEFGPSTIDAKNIIAENFKEQFLIETNSSLNLDNKNIESTRDDVKSILYGNEYGKETVK